MSLALQLPAAMGTVDLIFWLVIGMTETQTMKFEQFFRGQFVVCSSTQRH